MTEWLPIESAPRDGTVILLSDGKLFAAGHLHFEIESDWKFLGYDEGCVHEDGPFKGSPKMGPRFSDKVPNPNAGRRNEWWQTYGCTAFDFETETMDYDGPLHFTPTHWMPRMKKPTTP